MNNLCKQKKFQLVNLQVKEVSGEYDLTIDPNVC